MMVLTPYIAVCFAKFFKPIVVQAKPDKSKNSKFKIQNSRLRLSKGRPLGLAKIFYYKSLLQC